MVASWLHVGEVAPWEKLLVLSTQNLILKKHSYKIDASTSTTKLHSLELFYKQKIVFFLREPELGSVDNVGLCAVISRNRAG